MSEKHFIAKASNGGGLFPGRSVLVTEITREYPVPDFVTTLCEESATPAPSHAFPVNARAYAESMRTPAPPVTPAPIGRGEIRTRRGWSDTDLNEALEHLGFPKPTATTYETEHLTGPVTGVTHLWQRRAVEEWEERVARLLRAPMK